ncbi:MAG: hypothetical protein ABS46_04220 [Cytophagaceae bacterium SCN 52-12]|nr:MAG: hypothetical protein ABS46_04220 [Cytophagaceae bacterium SCN 52-12]
MPELYTENHAFAMKYPLGPDFFRRAALRPAVAADLPGSAYTALLRRIEIRRYKMSRTYGTYQRLSDPSGSAIL